MSCRAAMNNKLPLGSTRECLLLNFQWLMSVFYRRCLRIQFLEG